MGGAQVIPPPFCPSTPPPPGSGSSPPQRRKQGGAVGGPTRTYLLGGISLCQMPESATIQSEKPRLSPSARAARSHLRGLSCEAKAACRAIEPLVRKVRARMEQEADPSTEDQDTFQAEDGSELGELAMLLRSLPLSRLCGCESCCSARTVLVDSGDRHCFGPFRTYSCVPQVNPGDPLWLTIASGHAPGKVPTPLAPKGAAMYPLSIGRGDSPSGRPPPQLAPS